MTKDVTINAKVILARLAFISAALTRALSTLSPRGSLLVMNARVDARHKRKRNKTPITLRTPFLPRTRPRNLNPIPQWKQMVVRPRQVRGKNERKIARWTCSW